MSDQEDLLPAVRDEHCSQCGVFVGKFGIPSVYESDGSKVKCFECDIGDEFAPDENGGHRWCIEDALNRNKQIMVRAKQQEAERKEKGAPAVYHPKWMQEELPSRDFGGIIRDSLQDNWFDHEKYQARNDDRSIFAFSLMEFYLHDPEGGQFPNNEIWNRRREQMLQRIPELYSYGREEVYNVCAWAAAYNESCSQKQDDQQAIQVFFAMLQALEMLRKQLIARNDLNYNVGMDGRLQKRKEG